MSTTALPLQYLFSQRGGRFSHGWLASELALCRSCPSVANAQVAKDCQMDNLYAGGFSIALNPRAACQQIRETVPDSDRDFRTSNGNDPRCGGVQRQSNNMTPATARLPDHSSARMLAASQQAYSCSMSSTPCIGVLKRPVDHTWGGQAAWRGLQGADGGQQRLASLSRRVIVVQQAHGMRLGSSKLCTVLHARTGRQ